MRKFSIAIWAFVSLTILFVSCGPPARIETTETKQCTPRNLKLDYTADRLARIAWDPGCTGTRIMRGFNIYLSPEPLAERYPGHELPGSIKPFNKEFYPGDTLNNPNRETYECEEIDNATLYYVHVRAVYNDNTLSLPTNEIELIAYPQGEISLAVSYSGSKDGFSFAQNKYCRTDDIINDIYFYTKDGQDYLCSPARLGPVNRRTKIYLGQPGLSIDDLLKAAEKAEPAEKVTLRANGVYLIVTEDGYPARLQVKSAAGSENDRIMNFEYIYRPPVKRGKELSSR